MLMKFTTPSKSTVINQFRKYIHSKIDSKISGLTVSWNPKLPNSNELTLPDNNEVFTLPTRIPVPPLPDKPILSPHLLETRFHLISPRNDPHSPWLTRTTHFHPDGKSTVLNPFNLNVYLKSDPSVVGEISVNDCNVVEVAKPWSLLGEVGKDKVDTVSKKVVGGWNLDPGFNFAVLVQLVDDGGLFFKRDSEDWIRFESSSDNRVLDVVYHNGRFYAFELTSWRIGVIDPDKSEVSMEKYTGLFFPPPAWVKWCCPSLGNVELKLNNIKFTVDFEDGDDFDVDSDVGDAKGDDRCDK